MSLKQDGIVVTKAGPKIDGVIILADESANWVVAGLRQLVRLALSVDEYAVAARSPGPIPVCVLWTSVQPEAKERFPQHGRLTHLSFTDDFSQFAAEKAGAGYILIMDTRVVLRRNTLFSILRSGVGRTGPLRIVPGAELSSHSNEGTMPLAEDGAAHGQWFYLHEKREIGATERQLFAGTGKSQDGLISRFVNRPVSRLVSRWLVRSQVKPNQLTLLLTAIPVVGSLLLLRGDYLGFALGAVLFQVHSALDGCDGEIARVKYQDSAAGQKLDGLCDRISTVLYAIALGFGLSRHFGAGEVMRWIYPLEGIAAAVLLGVGETLLTRSSVDDYIATFEKPTEIYPQSVKEERTRFNEGDQLKLWAIKSSGLLFLGKGATSFFSEITKRDFFNFGFMLLALCGWPQVILHILAVCAGGIAVFAVKDLTTARPPDQTLTTPP